MGKILVTGGTGYIGSHTVVELQQQGYEVLIADNLSNSRIEVLGNIAAITGVFPEFEHIDLTDEAKTLEFFERHSDLDGVIHFAAFKAVGESCANPLMYYHNNLFSLVNVLEGMKRSGIRNLVFSSSCTVYGQPDELPVTEKAAVQKAWSPYGNTKQMCEDILGFSVGITGVKAIALRYFNPIGAHDSAMIGELPIGTPNNLMPFITQTAVGIRESLKVFGGDYDTVDGTAVRDYIHVVDIAKAHVVAVERMIGDKGKSDLEVFNLGTGNGFSVLEVIRSFEKMSGEKLNYSIVDRRPGDVEKVWADTRFANEELGWKAERSLDDMTLSAWKWELKLKANVLEAI